MVGVWMAIIVIFPAGTSGLALQGKYKLRLFSCSPYLGLLGSSYFEEWTSIGGIFWQHIGLMLMHDGHHRRRHHLDVE